jgi:transposase-like protein
MEYTPWGHSDRVTKIAEGILDVSTPSHGGIKLSLERQAQLPAGIKNFTGSYTWWEEDCDWVVPFIIFKNDIQKFGAAYKFIENLSSAYIIAERYHPEILNK